MQVTPAPAAAPSLPPEVAPVTGTAHRAVEAVLEAVHQAGVREHPAVTLKFSVGGSDLAVQVEWRGEAVRATFRTESPELRHALAQEWGTAVAALPAGGLRWAEPVFMGRGDTHTAMGGGQSQQHDRPDGQPARHGAAADAGLPRATRAGRMFAAPTPASVTVSTARVNARLQTFA